MLFWCETLQIFFLFFVINTLGSPSALYEILCIIKINQIYCLKHGGNVGSNTWKQLSLKDKREGSGSRGLKSKGDTWLKFRQDKSERNLRVWLGQHIGSHNRSTGVVHMAGITLNILQFFTIVCPLALPISNPQWKGHWSFSLLW